MIGNCKDILATCIQLIIFVGILAFSTNAVAKNKQSYYVPLQGDKCRTPAESIRKHYQSKDLEVIECRIRAKLKSSPSSLFIVSSDERSWIELIFKKKLWSTEDEIAYVKENQFGNFPNVSNAPAEIRTNRLGLVNGLIFRVSAQNSDNQTSKLGASSVSRLFVLGFKDSCVCFLGLVHDNYTARKLIDAGAECKRLIKVERLD